MTLFDDDAISRIQTWCNSVKKEITLQLALANHPEDNHFSAIADELESIAPMIKMTRTQSDQTLPGFKLTSNIDFCALPLERELPPFLDALSFIAGKEPGSDLDTTMKAAMDNINVPVSLKLYIALACPHCPAMVRTVIPLALYSRNIHLQIIDGSLFTEQTAKDNVLSAPTLILNDDFRWTRNTPVTEIIKMITDTDPSSLSAQTLKTILEKGDAQWLTDQMIKKGIIFDGFLKLLLHPTWSVRLGAMVVIENLAEQAPDISATICPALIEAFDKHETTVQGDILYALGESGTRDTVQWIRQMLPSLTHQDLVDAAQDAIDSIEARN